MTIIGSILAIVFLDPPWTFIVIGTLLLIDALEIFIWLKWRKKRSITGRETVVGQIATVVTKCDPEGQVKLRGAIWKAHCADGADIGDKVEVQKLDGLRLIVGPAESTLV